MNLMLRRLGINPLRNPNVAFDLFANRFDIRIGGPHQKFADWDLDHFQYDTWGEFFNQSSRLSGSAFLELTGFIQENSLVIERTDQFIEALAKILFDFRS